MRVKVDSLVITFPTTSAAMACEEFCAKKDLPGRMIPVPGQISAGCGLAWKVSPADRPQMERELGAAGIEWSGMDVVGLWNLA